MTENCKYRVESPIVQAQSCMGQKIVSFILLFFDRLGRRIEAPSALH